MWFYQKTSFIWGTETTMGIFFDECSLKTLYICENGSLTKERYLRRNHRLNYQGAGFWKKFLMWTLGMWCLDEIWINGKILDGPTAVLDLLWVNPKDSDYMGVVNGWLNAPPLILKSKKRQTTMKKWTLRYLSDGLFKCDSFTISRINNSDEQHLL